MVTWYRTYINIPIYSLLSWHYFKMQEFRDTFSVNYRFSLCMYV